MNIYVIEHLEPELYDWCIIEYKHMSKIVGKDNLWFTNIKKEDISKLDKYGKVFTESVKSMKLANGCVLDPESDVILTPKDSNFKYFIFGGILGDHPPRKRTEIELTRFIKSAVTRNIGKAQLSTDNAVYVVHEIIENKKQFKDIPFQDEVEIEINDIESTILPYRYPLVNGKPNISKELIEYLKKEE